MEKSSRATGSGRIDDIGTRVTGAVALALGVLTVAATPAAQASIVFDAQDGIRIAANDGSEQRLLVPDAGGAQISPDGATVTFLRHISRTNMSYFVVPATGGTSRLLIQTRRGASLQWAPDSRHVAVLREKKIVLVDVATGVERIVTKADGDFSFSPNGKHIAYGYKSKIYSVPTGGGSPKLLVRNGYNSTPLWGAKSIVFHRSAKHFPVGRPLIELYKVRPNGTHVRRLTHTRTKKYESGFEAVEWSRNGRRLVALYFAGSGRLGVTTVTVNPKTGKVRRVGPRDRGNVYFYPTGISRGGGSILGFDDKGILTRPYRGGPPTYLVRGNEKSFPDWTL